MKLFEIRLTQELRGHYEGSIVIEAKNKREALKKLKEMPKDEIDDLADWTHGDEYSGLVDSIEIREDEIEEIK